MVTFPDREFMVNSFFHQHFGYIIHLPSGFLCSDKNSAFNLIGVPLYVVFLLLLLRFFFLFWSFNTLSMMCLGEYFSYLELSFLDMFSTNVWRFWSCFSSHFFLSLFLEFCSFSSFFFISVLQTE